MATVTSDAIVLHAFDYRETSRIVRFLTRDAGLVSVLARGARGPRNRSGAAADLFTTGALQFRQSPRADLHQLTAFDAERVRPALGTDLRRFAAASMLAELALRMGADDLQGGGLFDATTAALDAVTDAPGTEAVAVGLAGAWRLVAESGHAPSLDQCAHCHADLADDDVRFHHRAGGALCARCAARATTASRRLPATARAAIRDWLAGVPHAVADPAHRLAHQRLLREFVEEHLAGDRALPAFLAWERAPA